MAFFSKVGNILKQTASKQINAELSATRPSIYQALRFMSSSKLFIGGLSYTTDEQSLKESFSKYGEVMEARVILDRETGRSRGFGFVTYTSSEEASSAIQALDGQDLHGRRVRVNYATERPRQNQWGPAPSDYGSYNTGGGNYGGSGGNYGGSGGNYGGNYSGGGQGSGGNYGSNYGGDSYSGGGGNYGGSNGNAGNYAGGNTYEGGNSVPYGSSSVAGGGVGSDTFVGSGPGGGYDGSTGLQYGGGDQLGSNESSSMGDPAGGFTPEDPVEGNYRDDDDDTGDYAKRA